MNDLTESYAAKVAAAMGAPQRAAEIYQIMSDWTPWEWSASYTGPRGKYNPLAITTKTNTSTPLGGDPGQNNGNPVQNYTSEDEGAKLTAAFLMNGRYPDVVQWMKTGQLDPAKVASQIRTWGTTGFANLVEQGHGGSAQGSQGAAGGGSTVADTSGGGASADTQSAKILAQLQGILGMEPQMDDPQFQDVGSDGSAPQFNAQAYARAHTAWSQTFTAVDNLYKNLAGVEGAKDQHHAALLADFQAKTTATHYANSDAQTKAQSDIDTFFKGEGESRARADLALKGQELRAQWGTAPGKSTFYANEDPATAATYRRAGLDPAGAILSYSGTQYVDPIGDMQRGDNLLGATGKPPSSANLLTGETDPNAGGGGTSMAPPAFASSIGGAIKGALPKIGDGRPAGYDLFDHSTGSPGGAFDGLTTPAYSNATGATPGNQNLLRGAGLTWDKAPALFKWG